MFIRPSLIGRLVTVMVIAAFAAGCGNNNATGEALAQPLPSPILMPTPTEQLAAQPTRQEIVQATPTLLVLGPLFDPGLDLKAGPVDVPLELQIPALKVKAPVLGVGLTTENNMDAPKGPIGDAVWHSAFWYRGSGIPGEPGTATFAGHVNDPLGEYEIFAHLQDLQPGDVIIVHYTLAAIDIHYVVDQIKVYSVQESADPAVRAQIFGAGAAGGSGAQLEHGGFSRLALITCAGTIVNGAFDHHTVVFATRSQ